MPIAGDGLKWPGGSDGGGGGGGSVSARSTKSGPSNDEDLQWINFNGHDGRGGGVVAMPRGTDAVAAVDMDTMSSIRWIGAG